MTLPCQTVASALPHLQDLDLGTLADTSPGSLEALGGLSLLTSLVLGGPPDEGGFRALGGLSSLVRLRILGSPHAFGRRCHATAGAPSPPPPPLRVSPPILPLLGVLALSPLWGRS